MVQVVWQVKNAVSLSAQPLHCLFIYKMSGSNSNVVVTGRLGVSCNVQGMIAAHRGLSPLGVFGNSPIS